MTWLALALLPGLLVPGAPAPPAPPAVAPYRLPVALEQEVLENGLTVTVVGVPGAELVATQVWYHVGGSHEEPGSRGLAHLFEHLMFGATDGHDAEAIARWHAIHGGYENAFTSPDETVYHSVVAPPHHLRVLQMEASRMRGLRLDGDALANEQRIVAEELRLALQSDPLVRAYVKALENLLGEHPYAVTPVGTPEDIESATLAGCRRFYDRYYGPGNAHVVVAGAVDPRETMAAVRAAFGGVPPAGSPPAPIAALIEWEFPRETVVVEDLPPAEIALAGFPLPPAADPDRAALAVMLELLAGGSVDPVREELVRRRGKALEAGTEALDLRAGGALVFYSVHLPYRRRKTAFRLLDETLDGLSRLEWLDEQAVAAARRRLVRNELQQVYYVDMLAAALGREGWWRGDAAGVLERAERLAAVDTADVERVFERYVGRVEPVRLYLEPRHVPLWIRLFGWLYPLVD